MNCCDEYGDCRQGRDCPVRNCKYCYGIGYDASGFRCECQDSDRTARIERLRKIRDRSDPEMVFTAYRDAVITRVVVMLLIVGMIWVGSLFHDAIKAVA